MATVSEKNSVINVIKIYLFPTLVTILATMIWRDVTELRSDVKQLLVESAAAKAKIERLEKQIDVLNQAVFKYPKGITSSAVPVTFHKMYAKHEDFFDINDYLPKNTTS